MMDVHDSIFRETSSRPRASTVAVRRAVTWPFAALALLLAVMGVLKLIDV